MYVYIGSTPDTNYSDMRGNPKGKPEEVLVNRGVQG